MTLALAITVSFLAVTYTTEAHAPTDEDVTQAPMAVRITPTVSPTPDYGPSSIYLEPELVLRQQPTPTAQAATVPDILKKAKGQAGAPPPQAPVAASTVIQKGPVSGVNITFYDCTNGGFCGSMYGGEPVYEGAAACSWDLPLDTAFYIEGDPTQRIYVCKDRGLLQNTWVDIFWNNPADGYNWQSYVGRIGTINIVYLP
jgi:hypothetical protein